MTFVGRSAELNALAREYQRPAGAFVVLHGRRRVGKSELLLQFLRSRPGIYFVGKTAPKDLQLREFAREGAALVDEPLIEALASDGDWKKLLEAIVDRWKQKRKLVIAFDEFQWTAETSPELVSVLQELWDRKWKKSGHVMLVLCGSMMDFMEREILGKKSPLFGRRTTEIRLEPFGLREAAGFHPHWSRVDQASAYFICGGVPLYHLAFDANLSIRQNVQHVLLSEFAPLFREADFLLREELRELENYHAVLFAIARGETTLRAIARETDISRGSVHYYTETLRGLGYVGKRYPLSKLGGRPSPRDMRFSLEDPLLRFWFRFVFPHQSGIARLGPRQAFSTWVAPELDAYFGACFERACRQLLPSLYLEEGVTGRFEVGEYWNKATQIDVVGLRDEGRTDLGECKWGLVRSARRLREELQAKAHAFPNPSGNTIIQRFFLRRKPSSLEPTPGEIWHDLRDLYR